MTRQTDHQVAFAAKCKDITRKQVELARFLVKYPDKWHTFHADRETVELVCAAVNLGIARINDFGQMQLKSAEHATRFIAARSETDYRA